MTDDERRARAIQNDPRVSAVAADLTRTCEECEKDYASAVAVSVMGALITILERKGLASVEECIDAFVFATGRVRTEMENEHRLASILGASND